MGALLLLAIAVAKGLAVRARVTLALAGTAKELSKCVRRDGMGKWLCMARAAFSAAGCRSRTDNGSPFTPHTKTRRCEPLIQAFEKANPDIKVDHFRQPGEELVAMIELELRAGSPKADVVGLNAASLNVPPGQASARSSPYAPKGIENVRQEFRDPQNIITPAFINVYLIHYNTKKISAADAPKSWADLDAPKWKGAVAMADPASSQSVQSFVWFIGDYLGKTDPSKFGWEYFKKLGANGVHLESSHGTIRDLTVSGERPLGVQLLANAQTAANRGEPTSVVWPIEGSPGEVSAFALMKDTKVKEAGQKWLDFVVSPEGQALMPNSLGGAPVRNDVPYKYPDGTPLDKVQYCPSRLRVHRRKSQAAGAQVPRGARPVVMAAIDADATSRAVDLRLQGLRQKLWVGAGCPRCHAGRPCRIHDVAHRSERVRQDDDTSHDRRTGAGG